MVRAEGNPVVPFEEVTAKRDVRAVREQVTRAPVPRRLRRARDPFPRVMVGLYISRGRSRA